MDKEPQADEGAARQFRSWKEHLAHLLATDGRQTSRTRNGMKKPVSHATIEKRSKVLFAALKQLRGLGYKFKTLDAIQRKHVEALAAHWVAEGLSASTIQNRLSLLRTLTIWLGKPDMVGPSVEFVPDARYVRRQTTAQYDHSWSAAGVDAERLIGMVEQYDKHVGMQLRLARAFYLRRQEAVMFRPHEADKGTHIVVRDGTKGGRERVVAIETDAQRQLLDAAKAMVKRTRGHVGHPDLTLKQALDRFSNVCRRYGITRGGLGITPHGLRHEGLNNLFEQVAGIPSPVRTQGDLQAVLDKVDKERLNLARYRVAEAAGHARLSISGSYIGGLIGRKRIGRTPREERLLLDWQRLLELQRFPVLNAAEQTELDRLRAKLQNALAAPAQASATNAQLAEQGEE